MSKKIKLLTGATLITLGVLVYILLAGRSNNVPDKTLKSSAKLPKADHIVIIVEENKSYKDIVGNPDAKYINSLISKGSVATNYRGTSHPSEPNYIEMTTGEKSGIREDCKIAGAEDCITNASSIVDDLEKDGKTWKAYMEGMESACSNADNDRYKTKHNPFIFYQNILSDPERCSEHIVPYTELVKDFEQVSTTPNYTFITPDICNDMHDCSVETGDTWLSREVPLILESPAFKNKNSLLVITWDEDNHLSGNHILTLFLGHLAKTGFKSDEKYNHYNLFTTTKELLLGSQGLEKYPPMIDMINTN